LAARLEQQVTGPGNNLVALQNRADLTGQHKGVFIFVVVTVHRRRQHVRREVVLDESKAPRCPHRR
jgi:hypothetical protein